ncbi:MAG: type II toxin-antitoxin system RelE/ParE family toxin [Lysobacterales bacterium]
MPVYKISEKAEGDLEAIVDYTLETWGAAQAVKYIDGLEDLAETLAQTPDLGKAREDLHKGLIVFPYERHLLFYRKERHGITIVRILHDSMDTPRHSEK